MELMAAIAALEALDRPADAHRRHRQRLPPRRRNPLDSRLESERLADRREEAGQERRPLAPPRRSPPPATASPGTGSRATPATPRTSAPTQLARDGMAPFKPPRPAGPAPHAIVLTATGRVPGRAIAAASSAGRPPARRAAEFNRGAHFGLDLPRRICLR